MKKTPRKQCQYLDVLTGERCQEPCFQKFCPQHGEIIHRLTRADKRNPLKAERVAAHG